jgi:hypothetical protein
VSSRRGTWLRWIGIATAVLVLIALGGSLFYRWQSRVRYERSLEKLRARLAALDVRLPESPLDHIRAREEPGVPDEENAVFFLLAGGSALLFPEAESHERKQALDQPHREWDDETKQAVSALFARNPEAFQLLHRAIPLETYSYAGFYDTSHPMEVVPRLSQDRLFSLLRAARALTIEARTAFGEGDWEKGMLFLTTLSRLASSLDHETAMTTGLIGQAIEMLMLSLVCELVSSGGPGTLTATRLQAIDSLVPPTDFLTQLERIALAEAYALESEAWAHDGTDCLRPWSYPSVDSLRAGYLEDCLAAVDLIRVPYGSAPGRFRFEKVFKSVLGQIGGHPSENDIQRFQNCAGRLALARAAVKLREIGIETGSYPPRPPEIPKLMQPDPFTGQKISYRVLEDGRLELERTGTSEVLKNAGLSGARWELLVSVTLPPPPKFGAAEAGAGK